MHTPVYLVLVKVSWRRGEAWYSGGSTLPLQSKTEVRIHIRGSMRSHQVFPGSQGLFPIWIL